MGVVDLTGRVALGLIVLGACLGAAPVPAESDAERKLTDLAGSWKLNEDLSQDPRSGRHQEGRGRGPRGGGRPPSGAPRRGGFGGQGPATPPDLIAAMAGGAKNLSIASEGIELRLAYGEDRRVLYTDGRKIREEAGEEKEIVRQARWREGHLEIVTRSERSKITEVWTLTNDHKRIFATVEIDLSGPMPALSFRRVWDRVVGDELQHDEGEERVSQIFAKPGTA